MRAYGFKRIGKYNILRAGYANFTTYLDFWLLNQPITRFKNVRILSKCKFILKLVLLTDIDLNVQLDILRMSYKYE